MSIVCWQTIDMKYQTSHGFLKGATKSENVVCCHFGDKSFGLTSLRTDTLH